MDQTKASCREHGFVSTLFGRRVHMPDIKSKNPAQRQFVERAAINAPIQGTAADIIRRAMVRIPGALQKSKLKAKMLLQVHDELVFEAPTTEVKETSKIVARVMEDAVHPVLGLKVPLTVETGSGPTWAAAH
jgi:DNA polymerase-1